MTLASILDPVQPTLSPYLWDHPEAPEPVLKSRHAAFIKRTVYAALERNGYKDPHKWLRLCLTGSLTTYQYADDSDCDIGLFVNSAALPEWSRAEMIGIMIGEVDGKVLPGTPYPLQDFVVGRHFQPGDLYRQGLRSGYDIDASRWIVPPERDRAHDTEAVENGFYAYALQMADKMDRLLRYEPDKAARFWHQIHQRRMADQKMGKGDFAESNIVYKFLAKRGLMPRLEEATGEHIAASRQFCPECTMPLKGHPFCVSCGWWEGDAPRGMRQYVCPDCGTDFSAQAGEHGLVVCPHCFHQEYTQLPDPTPQDTQPGGLTFPEHWASSDGPREAKTSAFAAPSQLADTIYDAILHGGGITIALDGSQPGAGFAFSPYKGKETVVPAQTLSPELIDQYLTTHDVDLRLPGHYLGAWVSDGHVYLDISVVEPDQQRATEQAAASHQLAIYDLSNFAEIPVQQAA